MSTSSRSSSRSQGPQTPEQIAQAEDQAPTRDETPVPPVTEATSGDSRFNALRDAPPPERKSLVWLVYEGRKARGSLVRKTPDEHIDVIVPDEANEGSVDAYLDQSAAGGTLSEQGRKQLEEAGISHDTIQLSGTHYHFWAGAQEGTPVHPDHVDWLLNHPGYGLRRRDDDGGAQPTAKK